jgi:hypothetical protein
MRVMLKMYAKICCWCFEKEREDQRRREKWLDINTFFDNSRMAWNGLKITELRCMTIHFCGCTR